VMVVMMMVMIDAYIYLIRQFDVEYGWILLRVTPYFDEPLVIYYPTNSKRMSKKKIFRKKYIKF